MNEYFFSHARTALKYGLSYLNFEKQSKILLPKFICDVVSNTILDCGLENNFYNISEDFKPDWSDIQNKIDDTTKAILMVNYFGIPQEVENFLSFSKQNRLKLIEDNAHGYSGVYLNYNLGEIGDISISSPRKNFNLHSGGILKINNSLDYNINHSLISNMPISFHQYLARFTKNKFKNSKFLAKKLFFNRPDYENLFKKREAKIDDFKIDNYSLNQIKKTNIEKIKSLKVKNFNSWIDFSNKHNLRPIFKKINNDLNPWCCPVYTQSKEESIYWYNWGWNNNIFVFSWPDLPSEFLNDKSIIEKWEKIVCFSTNDFYAI